jgi:chaperonin GroEL
MNKLIIPKHEYFKKLQIGLNKIADAVKSTLGPQGQNVMIQHADDSVTVTKDGVTVASIVNFKDRLENIGARLIKDVAQKTVDSSGDGTTTATVLAQAIINEGFKNIAAGANPMELKKGIDLAVGHVVRWLKAESQPIKTNDQLKSIATIAANNNEEIGKLIAQAFEKVGSDGIVTIEDGKTADTEVRFLEGMQFERGWQTPHFVTDNGKMEAVLENPFILIHDKKITNIKELMPVMEAVHAAKGSILLISDDLEGEAFATMVMNKLQHGLKICPVRAPLFGEWRNAILEDLAIVTGGTVVSEILGMRLDTIDEKVLGRAEKVVISREKTVIFKGAGKEEAVQARIEAIRAQIPQAVSEVQKNQLRARLAKLTGGIAIISVGAATEMEMGEKKDRIDDALQATRAAKEEGILPGGGVSYLRASEELNDGWEKLSRDEKTGIEIVKKALRTPIETILENAGESKDVIINQIRTRDAHGPELDYGYNAKTRQFEHFMETGIIDPTKVARLCLENAASVAGMLLTSRTIIYNDIMQAPQEQIRPDGRSFEELAN